MCCVLRWVATTTGLVGAWCVMAYLSKHKHEGCDSRLSTKKIRHGRRVRLKIYLSWEKSTLVFSSADIERSSVWVFKIKDMNKIPKKVFETEIWTIDGNNIMKMKKRRKGLVSEYLMRSQPLLLARECRPKEWVVQFCKVLNIWDLNPSRFPCCVLLALSWNTNEQQGSECLRS